MWEARSLTVRFDDTTALDHVSLPLAPGTVTAIVGSDGAGKSTLLRALLGLVPLVSGSIAVPAHHNIGYQPSHSGVWRHLTVDENIAFAGRAYGIPGTDLTIRRERLLGAAGLLQAGNRLGGHLSGGMRQKLGVVLAMLHQPDLLLLDEPTTGVDPVSRVELWHLMAEAAAGGTTVAFATTYLDEAERSPDILVLDQGQTLATGDPQAVVAAVPGTITSSNTLPAGPADRIWRRGTRFHQWHPPGASPTEAPIVPDLEDAVIALMLARAAAPAGGPGHA